MMTRSRALVALLVGATVASPPSTSGAQDRPGVAKPISAFGLDVFRHVASSATGPNVVFSPLSVGLAIALLTEGTQRETRAELHAALGTSEANWQRYQTDILALLKDLNADTTAVTRIASSLWADEGRRLRPGFVESARTNHRATVQTVDLQSDAAADKINGWARENTDGRIAKVMPPPQRGLALMLLNAVYFKGMWALPFDTTRTRLVPFVRAAGDTVRVRTMIQEGHFAHFEHRGEQGLRIPYRGGRYAAYVVVPRSISVQDLVARLTVADVDGWKGTGPHTSTKLYLPRLEHRGSWPLLEALAKAGVPRVVGKQAQLDGLWATRQEGRSEVSSATQSTFLLIDEKGTEAAAVSSFGISVTSAPPPPVVFRVDAPFGFIIRDETTGALMFIARIGDPTDAGGR